MPKELTTVELSVESEVALAPVILALPDDSIEEIVEKVLVFGAEPFAESLEPEKCGECDADLADGMLFCPQCGAEFDTPVGEDDDDDDDDDEDAEDDAPE